MRVALPPISVVERVGCPRTNPAHWAENHVFGPFNLENAATGGGYFLGDYQGMTAIGRNFMPFFSAPTATDPDNTYLATIAPQP